MVYRGLLIGRFQPPHLGHLKVINYILDEVDELVIVIAAAQISHTMKNPLKAGERLELMKTMLDNANIDPHNYWLVPAQDIFDNSLWVHHIKRLIPDISVFYSNNPFTKMLFRQAGNKTKSPPLFEREKYEATRIRNYILEDKTVSGLLDDDVNKLLKKWDITTRLRNIISDDSKYQTEDVEEGGSELKELRK